MNYYVVTNKLTNKKFIGMPKWDSLERIEARKRQDAASGNYNAARGLADAMSEDGCDNFTFEFILRNYNGDCREKLYDLIDEYKTFCPDGYNYKSRDKKLRSKHIHNRLNADNAILKAKFLSGSIIEISFRTLQDAATYIKSNYRLTDSIRTVETNIRHSLTFKEPCYECMWELVNGESQETNN